jgi:hypothetical protein
MQFRPHLELDKLNLSNHLRADQQQLKVHHTRVCSSIRLLDQTHRSKTYRAN